MKRSGLDILKALAEERLALFDSQARRRRLRAIPADLDLRQNSPAVLDLTHNDYLAFRHDEEFQSRARQAIEAWPLGSGASRLLGGEHRIFAALEERFSAWKDCEASLFFVSGYAANEALLSALAFDDVCLFSDALNHASLIDGMRLARIRPDQKCIFKHNDLVDLKQKLRDSTARLKIVVTESLFSMDGDFAPLSTMEVICDEEGALLLVDEAHALGIYGPEGAGLLRGNRKVITVNPCGKAMGASGAFVSGPPWLRELLINSARGFIYTTAASPWIAAALHACLPLIAESRERRHRLQELSHEVRWQLQEMDFDIGASASHIIPVILGQEAISLRCEMGLAEKGILVRAIRPPTVAEGASRLRLSLHAGLRDEDVRRLLKAMNEIEL